MRYVCMLMIALHLLAVVVSADQTTGWRGDGTGTYDSPKPPVRWSQDQNVVWKTPLPAPSKGSPIIVGDYVFTLSYPHSLLCLRRSDGKLLWEKTHALAEAVPGAEGIQLEKEFPVKPVKDLYWPAGDDLSQTTPVSDGKVVYCVFGNGVVSAHSLDGTRNWIKFIERSKINYGHAASPVLAGGFLIVHFDDLVALDPQTGRAAWRTKLAVSQATSAVTRIGEIEVLVHPSGALVRASDGKVLASDLFDADRASPLVRDETIYVHGEGAFYAFQRPSDISSGPRKLWETKATHGGYTIASPILHKGLLYGVNRNGIMEVLNVQSGELAWRERLPLGSKVHSGITLAGGLLYVGNEKGSHLVLRPGSSYEEVARNELGEQIDASPVFSGDRLYLRGEKHLFCISNE